MKALYVITLATCLLAYPIKAADQIIPVSEETKATATMLRDEAMKSNLAYDLLKSLTTEVGARHPGTPGEKAGIAWGVRTLKALGFDKVYTEEVKLNGWVRIRETAYIITPNYQTMVITALGRSKPTPEGGISGEIVHFKTYADLEKAEDGSLGGKIAFISNRMERFRDGAGYGPANVARSLGHQMAAKKGASALMIRSIGTADRRNPHTGATNIRFGYTAVPAVALSNPDADQLVRLLEFGHTPTVRIDVKAEDLGPITTQNVIGEITGREKPHEIVVIGGHLDSWDLGTGAVDDGAGVAITMAAAKHIMDKTNQRPRRTIRVILWGAEELGLIGARQYAAARLKDDSIKHHIIGSESDFGAGPVYGLQSSDFVGVQAYHVFDTMAAILGPLGIVRRAGNTTGGPDMIPLTAKGVPAARLMQDGTDYFDLHHTPDDTLDKVIPAHMTQNMAAWSVFTYIAAEWPGYFRKEAK